MALHVARDRGLEPGKAERVRLVGRPGHPAGKQDRVPVTGTRQIVEHLAAWVAQPQQPGHFVVGLPRGVVDGAAQFDDRLAERPHVQQVSVAAGHQQRHALG